MITITPSFARGYQNRGSGFTALFGVVACAAALGSATQAVAQTRAGTEITNVAALRYDIGGTPQTLQSNAVTIIVAERLDIGLSRDGQGAVTVLPDPTPVAFTLTNSDNGEEAFDVASSLSTPAATLRMIAVDGDGDGHYDPAHDTPLADGVTPMLVPGQTIKLLALLVATDPTTAVDGSLTVTASAVTGSGRTGKAYDGQGDGGGDAVVGPTGAAASIAVPLRTAVAGPSLIKTQSVRAADGSSNAVRDAVVTYKLEARFVGALADARVDDPLPAGTAYVPGSLRLDGAPLSDSADGDSGGFDGTGIGVALAQVAAGSVHVIEFKAKIQ